MEHLCALNVIESATFWGGSRGTTRPYEPRLVHGESITISYFDKKLEYMNAGQSKDELNVGTIAFTSVGKDLLSICQKMGGGDLREDAFKIRQEMDFLNM